MEMTVKDVMTANVTTLKRNEKLTLADDLMNLGRIRHLPVLDDGEELIGIVASAICFAGRWRRRLVTASTRAANSSKRFW